MTERPALTVALPTCNGAWHLAETLRSVLGQPEPFDLVVSDDRSDDGTLAIVRELAGDRARVEVNSERLGLAGNWNRCVALSHSPFVAIVHQDDVWRPGHLDAHRRAIASDGELGLIASAAGVIDDSGREVSPKVVGRGGLGPIDRLFGPGEAVRPMAPANPLRCSAVTISTRAHREIGGFDPTYRYVVDWDFWLRAARSFPIAWLSAPTVDVRWHERSETHRFRVGTGDLDETARLVDETFHEGRRSWADAETLRREADRGLALAYLNRAHVALKAGDAVLASRSLKRARRLHPAAAARIATDPRLAAQMATLAIWPALAARLFRRESGATEDE